VLLAPELAEPAFEALMAELHHQVPRHLGLNLSAVRQNSPVWGALKVGCVGYVIRLGLRSEYSFLDVGKGADTYWSRLGNMRRNVKRYRRRLDNRGHVSVEMSRGSTTSEGFFSEYLALEASGWKGHNGTAMISDPNAVAFYTTLIQNFAAQDRWEWHVIRVGGRVVAAGMGVRCGVSLMVPKIAFNEDFADCMPGNLLTAEMIKDAFSRPDLYEVNHLSKAKWHRLWRMSQDEYVDVHLVRWSVVPILFQLPCIAIRSVYQDYVRPRIPAVVKEVFHRFKHRGVRRHSQSQSAHRNPMPRAR
jgi:hypothetical protein